MLVRVCPKCLSLNVHRSRRQSLLDRLVSMVFQRPYRCASCEHRFFASVFSRKLERSYSNEDQ